MSRNLVFGEHAKNVTIKLYSWEKMLVKAYVKALRIKKRKEIEKEKKNANRTNTRSKGKKLGETSG